MHLQPNTAVTPGNTNAWRTASPVVKSAGKAQTISFSAREGAHAPPVCLLGIGFSRKACYQKDMGAFVAWAGADGAPAAYRITDLRA